MLPLSRLMLIPLLLLIACAAAAHQPDTAGGCRAVPCGPARDQAVPWTGSPLTSPAAAVSINLNTNPVPAGILYVYVTPGGGTVCIGSGECHNNVGVPAGMGSTQFTVPGNSYQTVTVKTDGYEDYSARVYAAAGQITTVNIALVPNIRPTGSIQVSSEPSGATACVDGSNCTMTPATFSGVLSGTYHTVTVTLNGFLSYSEDVYVVVQETYTVNAVLRPSATPSGTLQVPAGPAEITTGPPGPSVVPTTLPESAPPVTPLTPQAGTGYLVPAAAAGCAIVLFSRGKRR
ncbi:MAG TPA: PEGA domain-containing protein [Methanoregula sp.]|nr:PEGA domain-containing protein [Methanoregula sp.]